MLWIQHITLLQKLDCIICNRIYESGLCADRKKEDFCKNMVDISMDS